MSRLRIECENAKKTLSSNMMATINKEALAQPYKTKITRPYFQQANKVLIESTIKSIDMAIRDAGMTKSNIDRIILIGGSTRIPMVQTVLEKYFPDKTLDHTINPDEAVALGAAAQAAIIQSAGQSNTTGKKTLLVHVTPMSLGLRAKDDEMTVIIKKCSKLPAVEKRVYRTTIDNKKSMEIKIYEGEGLNVEENNVLDAFCLSGIAAAPAEKTRMTVNFDIDVNSILKVTAYEIGGNNKRKKMFVNTTKRHLSARDIERMANEHQQYCIEEMKRKEGTEAYCKLQSYCLEMSLQTMGNEM